MTFFLNSEDKTLREGVVLEWVGAELKSGSVVTVDNGPAPLRRATVTELGRPVDERGRRLLVDVVANVMISGERFGLRQLYDSKVGSLWVITGRPYSERLAA
jgi:hypothetical protein